MKKRLAATTIISALMLSSMAYAHDDVSNGQNPSHPSFLAGLPEADAQKFRDAMHQSHEKTHALHEKMHALHEDLYKIVTAEHFDKSAFIAKSKELAKLHEKIHSIKTEAFANALAQLPQDERTTLADAMKKHRQEHHHHWHPDAEHQGDPKPSDSPAQ